MTDEAQIKKRPRGRTDGWDELEGRDKVRLFDKLYVRVKHPFAKRIISRMYRDAIKQNSK